MHSLPRKERERILVPYTYQEKKEEGIIAHCTYTYRKKKPRYKHKQSIQTNQSNQSIYPVQTNQTQSKPLDQSKHSTHSTQYCRSLTISTHSTYHVPSIYRRHLQPTSFLHLFLQPSYACLLPLYRRHLHLPASLCLCFFLPLYTGYLCFSPLWRGYLPSSLVGWTLHSLCFIPYAPFPVLLLPLCIYRRVVPSSLVWLLCLCFFFYGGGYLIPYIHR